MVEILMATYNGEKYLKEQLDSILSQTCSDWHLTIADDCSTDNTVAILKEYAYKYPEKITYHVNKTASGSAKNNFYGLLMNVDADYVMLSDQDDFWLENKIELTLNKMKESEAKYGSGFPLLVHSDLRVVDEKLQTLNVSFYDMERINPRLNRLNNILVTNVVAGCTMMANRSLLNRFIQLPKNSTMHDHWFALIAAAFGKIIFIEKATILYRQHASNSVGVNRRNLIENIKYKIFSSKKIHQDLVMQYRQAREFLNIYANMLTDGQSSMLEEYSNFEDKSIFEKFFILKKYSMNKENPIKFIGQLVR